MFERLWLPNSTKAISLNIFDEGIDALDHRLIRRNPKLIIIPGRGREDDCHSTKDLTVPSPIFN